MKKKWLVALLLLLLAGCNEQEHIRSYSKTSNEQLQNQVAQIMKENDAVESANIIALENELFVAMQLKPFSKWKKQKIETQWQQKLEKQFEENAVLISADFKLYWESSKLLNESNQQKVLEELHRLKKLSKEET